MHTLNQKGVLPFRNLKKFTKPITTAVSANLSAIERYRLLRNYPNNVTLKMFKNPKLASQSNERQDQKLV